MLLERDRPFNQLTELIGKCRSGNGSIALVSGEAGIGKTSLIENLRDRLNSQYRILWGGCDALYTPRPLGPIHDMHAALGVDAQRILNTGDAPINIHSALLEDLQESKSSTVMVIEDIHWADQATLDFIKYIGRRIAGLSTLLILSYRDDEIDADHDIEQLLGELPQAHVHRLPLKPLTLEGVKSLNKTKGRDHKALHKITGGNPFFVTELIAVDHDPANTVPASVKDAVSARLKRLNKAERDFLETASVIPGPLNLSFVKRLFGESGETLAMSCVGRNLMTLSSNGAVRFRHELARLATLSHASVSEQVKIHKQVLAAYLDGARKPSLDVLVHHASSALDAKHVLLFAPQAAKSAAAIGAHREAASHLATALRFVGEAEPEIAALLYEDWAYEAGLSIQINDDVIEARRHAITLWRALGRPEKIGDNLRWLSRLHWYRGESAEATRLADEAIRVLETIAPSSEKAMAYSLRSQLHMLNGQSKDAVDWGKRALELANTFDNTEVKIHALNNIGTSLVFDNQPQGIECLQESLSLALEHKFHEHAARVYTNFSEYAVEFKSFDLAERLLREGIAFDTENDLDSWTHYLIGRLAQLRLEQGRYGDAAVIAKGVLEIEKLTLLMRLPAKIALAKTRIRLGEKGAEELVSDALLDAIAVDELQYLVPLRLALMELAWLDDRLDLAREQLEILGTYDLKTLHIWDTGEIALWAHRFGIAFTEINTDTLESPHKLEISGDNWSAADEWVARGMPYAGALALMNCNEDAATQCLARALQLLAPINANAAVAKVRLLASKFGVLKHMPKARKGAYKAARQHPLGLTKREQQILGFVANGYSNKKIASELNRSERTIENHVSNLLSKLNSKNRMEAMLRVQYEPWLISK